MIFLDAGPLIAFFNRRDNQHDWAKKSLTDLYQSGKQLMTTNRVVSEVYGAIRYDKRVSRKKDARPALAVFEALSSAAGFISVEFLTEDMENKAIDILRAYPDQNFSFCDACSFAAIDVKRVSQICTLDQKDFRVYHFKHQVTFI